MREPGGAHSRAAPPPEAAPARASPPWAVAALVVANAVPLVGVLFWDWSVFDLMLLYWFENGVIGVYAALTMLLTRGSMGDGAHGPSGLVAKLFVVAFFTVHYGAFWSAHGFFLVTLFGPSGPFGAVEGSTALPFLDGPFGFFAGGLPIASRFLVGGLVLPALGLVLSHGLSFFGNVLQRGEDLQTPPNVLMARPYGRVFVLHTTLIFGAFLIAMIGQPAAGLVAFVVIKTGVDLNVHVRTHRNRPTAR